MAINLQEIQAQKSGVSGYGSGVPCMQCSTHLWFAFANEWSWERGGTVLDRGELAGSRRMPYWELHREGQEALRSSIGLND